MRIATLAAAGLSLLAAAAPQAQNMVITGVFDGPLPGGLPKVVEFYATDAIPDLSRYAFGSANNGGGTDGAEFTFAVGTATAGQYVDITAPGSAPNDGVAAFAAYFGFAADGVSDAANINGDDAIELFFDANGDGTFDASEVIDVFGQIDVDGTAQPWEYLDGWAYRKNNTGPDGTMFVIANWTFSGVGANTGQTSNGTATTPFPIRSYTRTPVAAEGAPRNGLTLAVANPVRGAAQVRFSTETTGTARLALYDVLGRRVATLADGVAAGAQAVTLDAAGLAPGVYLLRLDAGGRVLTQTVTVVR